MALPVWPSTVEHRPSPASWAPALFSPPRATQMEGGNTRLRVKPGDPAATSKWGQEMSNGEFAAFSAFYRDLLKNGSLRFSMPVCLDGFTYETRTVQIVAGSLRTSAAPGSGVALSFELKVF